VSIAPPPGRTGLVDLTPPIRRGGIVGWAASTDHKRIGLLQAGTSLLLLLVSGALALVMRVELAAPGLQVLSEDAYNQMFSMHGSAMIYLVATPLALALGIYLVPLQIGAAGLLGARVALLGYWLFAVGALVMYAGFATVHGAGRAGWTAFPPLSGSVFSPGTGMDLWIAGVVFSTLGMTLQAVVVMVTILRARAPGLTLLRLPIFSWAMLGTCFLVVTSFPLLLAAMLLLWAQRHTGLDVFDPAGGPQAYQQLFWWYGHPAVYVIFFPFLGAVAESVATFSRRRLFGYPGMVISLMLFTALSMSVWAHHMFTTGAVTNEYFALNSTILAIPAGLEYLALVGTLVGGALVLSTALLFSVGFLALFLIGGLSGIFTASPPLDYHVHDTYFVVAHFHYTIFAGSLFGLFAGIFYWFPKATGLLLREGLGKLQFALFFVGVNLTFFPMFVLGWEGMPRRVADYGADAGFTTMNQLATAGAGVIVLGFLAFLWNVVTSVRRPRRAGNDPWGGQTLEWYTTSPPPRHNFDALPPVRSHAPLLDLREREREE
jgi:cytochrome c oxidase subunit 1